MDYSRLESSSMQYRPFQSIHPVNVSKIHGALPLFMINAHAAALLDGAFLIEVKILDNIYSIDSPLHLPLPAVGC